MPRQVFYSFHFNNDVFRVQQIRNIGNIDDNKPTSEDTWDSIKREGPKAIKDWIGRNMKNRSCVIVLIGNQTHERPYVKYEIEKAWNDGRGLLGIHIHNLKNAQGNQSSKGKSPFKKFDVKIDNRGNKANMDNIVKRIDPPYDSSQNVYNHIRNNMEDWVEEAIAIRKKYP